MRKFAMSVDIGSTWEAGPAFDRLSRHTDYPSYSSAVRSVTEVQVEGTTCATAWETEFRGGILKWTEEDVFDEESMTISFRQLAGDLERFDGEWRVVPGDGDTLHVEFRCLLDLGVPTLDAILNPIAEEAILDNVAGIIEGLFGPGTRLVDAVGLPVDPASAEATTLRD